MGVIGSGGKEEKGKEGREGEGERDATEERRRDEERGGSEGRAGEVEANHTARWLRTHLRRLLQYRREYL